MPTLRALLAQVVRDLDVDREHLSAIEHRVRCTWAGERVYIPPAHSRRDPERKIEIKRAASKLPTRVVAERHGVSESYVRRIKKGDP